MIRIEARTAIIRRGLRLPTQRALRALSRAALARLRSDPTVDPQGLQTATVEAAKAILHREIVAVAINS